MVHRDEYRRALALNVCARCIDRGPGGACGLPEDRQCAMTLHADPLIEAVLSVTSPGIAPYQDAVRSHVCAACADGSTDTCCLRDQLDCALDRYLPLVVGAIEETHAAADYA